MSPKVVGMAQSANPSNRPQVFPTPAVVGLATSDHMYTHANICVIQSIQPSNIYYP